MKFTTYRMTLAVNEVCKVYFLKESEDYPGYYLIPGYANYVISPVGIVKNIFKKTILSGSYNPAGYKNIRITGDDGYCKTWGLHRLLGYVFKNPGTDIKNLVINHIDGNKANNYLDNLEWVSYQGNSEHAGAMGLTTKCRPISVRDYKTLEVKHYPSIVSCANEMGTSKDFVNWRVKKGPGYLFPELKQYRFYTDSDIWPELKTELKRKEEGLLLKEILTNEIRQFKNLTQLSKFLNKPISTVHVWLNQINQPVLPGLIQLKKVSDKTEWRVVKNPHCELALFTGEIPVTVIDDVGGKRFYSNLKDCSINEGIPLSTLSLNLSKSKFFIKKNIKIFHTCEKPVQILGN